MVIDTLTNQSAIALMDAALADEQDSKDNKRPDEKQGQIRMNI